MWDSIFKIAYEKIAGRERGDPTPELVDHVAARIMKEHPEYTREQAYAIAVKQLQRTGHLKPGTMQLTEKGRKRSAYHSQHSRALEWRRRGY
jgi:hypothetical protein